MYLDILQRISTMRRPAKRGAVIAVDVLVCVVAVIIAYALRVGVWKFWEFQIGLLMTLCVGLFLPIFALNGVYSAIFRYAGRGMMRTIVQAGAIYGVLVAVIVMFGSFAGVPRTVGIIQPIVFVAGVIFTRLLARYFMLDLLGKLDFSGERRALLVYGAGSSGQQLVNSLSSDPAFHVVGYVDDDIRLHGQRLDGVRVFHSEALEEIIEKFGVTDVMLALPRVGRGRRRDIVSRMESFKLRVKTLPPMADIMDGKVTVDDIQDLDVEDLLGREPVAPNELLLGRTVFGKCVMVTGAGGSIGSELCRQIVHIGASRVVLFEISEFALYNIEKELLGLLSSKAESIEIVPVLGSVRDHAKLQRILTIYQPETIYHAAAYKHVPLVEANPVEGIRNNVLGTHALVTAAAEAKVKDFILISTDKAVRPTNVMGATKRVAELIVQSHAQRSTDTRFSMVRFGNVLGSSGSVVPLFRKQIMEGGPITLTHKDVTRYFMTIPEAAQLVIQAGGLAKGGEVFVLDMGESVRIIDLARTMVHLSGLTLCGEDGDGGDIAIEEVGLRPGEKLYEELLIGDDPQPTKHPKILMAHEASISFEEIVAATAVFEVSEENTEVLAYLEKLVPEFNHRKIHAA